MEQDLEPDRYRALTFDCYGTLVDWRLGAGQAVAAIEALAGCDLERLLRDRESEEAAIQRGAFQTYDRVLAQSIQRAARLQGRAVGELEAAGFAGSMGRWPAFPDSADALRRLAKKYRLAILSNVQPDVLARSISLLAGSFEAAVTAGEIHSYKPARAHFDRGLAHLGLQAGEVLHCACSLYHDVRPALELGWSVAWVNREGLPLPGDVEPDLVVPDLAALAQALGV